MAPSKKVVNQFGMHLFSRLKISARVSNIKKTELNDPVRKWTQLDAMHGVGVCSNTCGGTNKVQTLVFSRLTDAKSIHFFISKRVVTSNAIFRLIFC